MAIRVSLEEFLGSEASAAPSAETMTEKMTIDTLADVFLRMKELSVNQKQLAERLGISASALSKLLSNGSNLRYSTVARLAAALKCDVVPPKLVPIEAESVYENIGTLSSQMTSRTEVHQRINSRELDSQYKSLCEQRDRENWSESVQFKLLVQKSIQVGAKS